MSSRFTVEFRIYGKTLDPGALTELLALKPCQVVLAGARRGSRMVEEAMWAFNGSEDGEAGSPEWAALEEGLKSVLEMVAARAYCPVQRRQQEDLVVRSVSDGIQQRNDAPREFTGGIG